jgi:nucleotide-binding universal stress UspA family protein
VLRVLIPVDGSQPAERAVRHVIALHAAGTRARVLLVNVQEPWAPARSRDEEAEGKRLHARAADRATRRAQALLRGAGIPFENRMLVGSAAEKILQLARASRSSHIVMGMRGRGAVARVVLGSVSMKVLQLARVPLTLVK